MMLDYRPQARLHIVTNRERIRTEASHRRADATE
jgi:hypothetical protein